MLGLKEYATQMMLKENSEPSIEKEWKTDRLFLPGQIDDGEDPSSGGSNDVGNE
jgi:hypothetical protein